MKKALLVLALAISSLGLKAEESQVPFKVGDVIALCLPSSSKERSALVMVVKEIKGKWVSDGGYDLKGKDGKVYRSNFWANTDSYIGIDVNNEEDLSSRGILPRKQIPQNTNTTPTYSIVDGKKIYNPISKKVNTNTNTSTNFFPRPRRKVIPIPTDENQKKDAPPVGEEAK